MDFNDKEMEDQDIYVLTDEVGDEHKFILLKQIKLDDEQYAVLQPVGEDEAIILKFGNDENGDEILYDIEDDEEWERVADAYEQLVTEDES